MCMEDIRIGRKTSYSAKNVFIPGAVETPLVQKADDRVALVISGSAAADLCLCPYGLAPAAARGIVLTTETPVLSLTIEHHGSLVTAPWTGIISGGTMNVTVLEVFLGDR